MQTVLLLQPLKQIHNLAYGEYRIETVSVLYYYLYALLNALTYAVPVWHWRQAGPTFEVSASTACRSARLYPDLKRGRKIQGLEC